MVMAYIVYIPSRLIRYMQPTDLNSTCKLHVYTVQKRIMFIYALLTEINRVGLGTRTFIYI